PAAPMALVFVSGAVVNPGLYRVSAAARGVDAIAAAGGLSAEADLGRLPDLAARVHDGRQLNVPFQRGSGAGLSGGGGVGGTARLDVNSATIDELHAIPGMPAGLPEAIIERRANWGPFLSFSDLTSALALDRQAAAALRPFLRVVVPR
ncbi:MAG: helix-hairpin-helix domain-containing protein, partial [Candidatus Dormibacteria bacterium]